MSDYENYEIVQYMPGSNEYLYADSLHQAGKRD